MPTYKNKTNSVQNVNNYSFSPREEKQTYQYINLNTYENILEKTSNLPEIIPNFNNILSNITTSQISSIYDAYNPRMVLKVKDGTVAPTDDDEVTLRLYMGNTDDLEDFFPIGADVVFTRETIGSDVFWVSPNQIIDNLPIGICIFYFIYVVSASLTGDGNVNIYSASIG